MNIKELRLKDKGELSVMLNDLRKQLDDLKFKVHQGQLKSVREIRVIKKDIARILMSIKEKN